MRRLFLLRFLLLSALANGQSFDAPGTDPTWSKSQPNDHARLIQGSGLYPANPARTEYYKPVGGNSFTASVAWNLPDGLVSISARHYTPIQHLTGIAQAHARGYTGSGVKIVVIEEYGYSNGKPHDAIGHIAGTYDQYNDTITQSYQHTTQILSTIAARSTGAGKLIGGAYGASVYVAKLTDLVTEVQWATSIGADIISISFDPYPNEAVPDNVRTAFRAFQRQGGVIIVAAGNGGSLGQMQKLCGLPNVVCVGATVGGTVLTFQEALYSRKVQPVSGRSLDFALPAFTYAATFSNLDEYGAATESSTASYKLASNTSFTAPQVACLYAILMQQFPRLSPRLLTHMLRRNAASFGADNTAIRIPSLNFLR